jgi:hypothetical protein
VLSATDLPGICQALQAFRQLIDKPAKRQLTAEMLKARNKRTLAARNKVLRRLDATARPKDDPAAWCGQSNPNLYQTELKPKQAVQVRQLWEKLTHRYWDHFALDRDADWLAFLDDTLEILGHMRREDLPEYLSAKDLADRLGLPREATRKKLDRLFQKFPDCAIDNEAPRRRESKRLYRVADVLPHLR